MENNYLIYGLVDPETNEIRYIGKTNNLKRRIYFHKYYGIRVQKTSNQHVLNWIHSLIVRSLEFGVVVLEENLTESESIDREIYWIKFYQETNNLCNHNEGGLGFGLGNKIWKDRHHTEETKQKIRTGNRGIEFSTERRISLSNGHPRQQGDSNYRSKNNRGFRSNPVKVFDSVNGELLHEFSSILECSKVLNLNRTFIKRRFLENKPYARYKFQIGET